MSLRTLEHLLQYSEPSVRYTDLCQNLPLVASRLQNGSGSARRNIGGCHPTLPPPSAQGPVCGSAGEQCHWRLRS